MADEPPPDAGARLHALVAELYPFCRSITGDGVRRTLAVLSRIVPLEIHELATGTPVLDWTIPREWNVKDAWIKDASGRRVVDFAASNLHVVSYSVPVRARLSLAELRPHLHTLPDRPDWVPYRRSFYEEGWGFCLSQRQLDSLLDGDYEVCIDSSLEPGHLTYGELLVPGETEDEILISSHVCHPSLCDDNLSSIAVSTLLAERLLDAPRRRYGVRFLFAPGTIGAIAWLACNRPRVGRVKHGLTLACIGDAQPFTYKRTLAGDAPIDRAAELVLRERGGMHEAIDFIPWGYDERQYNSPGLRLPVGALMRGRHNEFPEYHTSADNLDFVRPDSLAESLEVCDEILDVLQSNATYRSLCPDGEPQLGRRGLFRETGGSVIPGFELAMLWVLTLADGQTSLVDMARRSHCRFRLVREAADRLLAHGLLAAVWQ